MRVCVVVAAAAAVVCGTPATEREGRFFFINPGKPTAVTFLLNVPLSLALPTLAPVNGRSLDLETREDLDLDTREDLDLETREDLDLETRKDLDLETREDLDLETREEEVPEDLAWDEAYDQPLKRLLAYFEHLELSTMVCQERLICEITADPQGYSPITQIFTKELRLIHGPVDTTEESLMWRYLTAAREGFTEPIERCVAAYPRCPLSADGILDMSVLKVWQFLASKLNLKLK